jgi:hypothetical protein
MKREFIFAGVSALLLLASVSLNVSQARHLREIERLLVSPGLDVGTILPPLKTQDLSGRNLSLNYDSSHPTILYVFSPSCEWCKRNSENVRSLASQAAHHYHFVALSLSAEGLQDYMKQYGPGMETYVLLPSDDRSQVRAWATPTTVVLSSKGKLIDGWVGAYVGINRTEIEHFFSIRLPADSQ